MYCGARKAHNHLQLLLRREIQEGHLDLGVFWAAVTVLGSKDRYPRRHTGKVPQTIQLIKLIKFNIMLYIG
jgi:hypothetical protein